MSTDAEDEGGVVGKLLDWKVWDSVNDAIAIASQQHPMLVFFSLLFTGILFFGLIIWYMQSKANGTREVEMLKLALKLRSETDRIRRDQYSSGIREVDPSSHLELDRPKRIEFEEE